MSTVDSILGQAGSTSTQDSKKSSEDKDMFLKLLVAQLSNQDPLNPVEDKEFIAQLAQFTQVEELQKLNEGMDSMVKAYDQAQFTQATMLLGTRVLSAGSSVSKVTDSETGEFATTPVYFTSETDMATCTVNVHGPGGYILYSEDYGSRQAGSYDFVWNGKGPGGMVMPDGVYELSVSATDVNGNKIMTKIEVFGDVVQVERTEDGTYNLILLDKRTIKLDDVSIAGYVVNGGSGGTEEPEDPENPDDENKDDENKTEETTP